jgi:MoaA/NifB/PqqE/SkfB family radical SAM enzyme
MSADLCNIQSIPATTFFRRLRNIEHQHPCVPLAGSMDWTRRCNLACRHCYIRHAGPDHDEMTTSQLTHVLDELARAGMFFIVVTGGDPLLRSDFKEVYLHALAIGLIPTVFTNATLITPELAGFLASHPPRRMEVSVYGHTRETYEFVTGVPGSFDRFRAGVSALLERGVLLRLKAMVMQANKHEFEDIKAWVKSLHCEFRYDAVIHPRLDGDHSPNKERLSASEAVSIQVAEPSDRAEVEAYLTLVKDGLPPREQLFECGAGVMTMHVDAAGQAHPCMLWRNDPYNLLTSPLDERWFSHIEEIRNRPSPPGRCTSCGERGLCNYCPPLASLEAGNPSAPTSYYCDLAASRRRLAPAAIPAENNIPT